MFISKSKQVKTFVTVLSNIICLGFFIISIVLLVTVENKRVLIFPVSSIAIFILTWLLVYKFYVKKI